MNFKLKTFCDFRRQAGSGVAAVAAPASAAAALCWIGDLVESLVVLNFEGRSIPWSSTGRYRGGGVAALAARVGGDRAVLCGTHPELHPDWLAAACDANELVASGACLHRICA